MHNKLRPPFIYLGSSINAPRIMACASTQPQQNQLQLLLVAHFRLASTSLSQYQARRPMLRFNSSEIERVIQIQAKSSETTNTLPAIENL